jgi:hypothetical protein
MQNQEDQPAIRDVVFGDLPLSEWPSASSELSDEEPWASFIKAGNQLNGGDEAAAKEALRGILAMPDLESRHYLQAWHFLRELGEQPSAVEAKQLYGVVVEVGMDEGLDIVAAYADHTARYFNYSGAAIIWERPDDSLDADVDALLGAGRIVAAQIGPWEGARPDAPDNGQVRISMLVPSGLHFGEAPFEILSRDPMGGPVISAAMRLMQGLISKSDQS